MVKNKKIKCPACNSTKTHRTVSGGLYCRNCGYENKKLIRGKNRQDEVQNEKK